jgi:hypothetical protein
MPKKTLEAIGAALRKISESKNSSGLIYKQGYSLYLNGQCSRLSASEHHFEFTVNDTYGDFLVKINTRPGIQTECSCKAPQLCRHRTAALMQLHELIKLEIDPLPESGIKYTHEGMIKRVAEERRKKALKAKYTIQYADNIFGEHLLTNERGVEYLLTFRDPQHETGYCSCPDYRTNKLGTCKHLMFAFNDLKKNYSIDYNNLPVYPFIEVFLNPKMDNKISWYYPEKLYGEVAELFYKYFGNKKYIEDKDAEKLLGFFNNLDHFRQILVRPEVFNKVKNISEDAALKRAEKDHKLNFSNIKTNLLPYQKEGIQFATFRKGAVIADELGLGKTVQAIGSAIFKKEILGFTQTLIICPATLKNQWVEEIKKFTSEDVLLIEGNPDEREQKYLSSKAYFKVVSYETILRDKHIVSDLNIDFVILDEAQRISDYASKTSSIIKAIQKKHALVLTGTPVESELIELYSIILFVDPELLAPLWEFSYQHCYFDSQTQNTIVGFYDLPRLHEKLKQVLIRRQRKEVIKQLPNLDQFDIPVKLTSGQKKLHIRYAREIIQLLSKKIFSSYDLQRIFTLVNNLRMASNAAYLVDGSSGFSPKIDELKHILLSKIHIHKSNRKVLIITEWKQMQNMIARMLTLNKLPFLELQSETEETKKQDLATYKIFLAAPDSLKSFNLNDADTIINMEVPKSAGERNDRYGSIGDFHKKSNHITIINLIAQNSLESSIASGLEIEFNLAGKLFSQENQAVTTEMNSHLQKQLSAALKESIEQMILSDDAEEPKQKESDGQMRLNFDEDEPETEAPDAPIDKPIHPVLKRSGSESDTDMMDELFEDAFKFLSSLLRAGTGNTFLLDKEHFDFDSKTGEINIRLRLSKKDL